MPSAGYQLTVLEAFALCYRAGWRFLNLVRAVAVMSAESARFVDAYHDNDNGSQDRGLFQINSLHGDASTFNQLANVTYAHALWVSRGFQPWAAYNHGKHLQYMPALLTYMVRPWRFKRLIPEIPFGP